MRSNDAKVIRAILYPNQADQPLEAMSLPEIAGLVDGLQGYQWFDTPEGIRTMERLAEELGNNYANYGIAIAQ